jgi:catechol 2,3-dioxygenase-like lactoylglutathione lyase family enzyme
MAMSIIRVEDIAHVRFAAPDLQAMRAFLEDFGLACFEQDGRLYAKGGDGRPFLHVTEPGEPGFRGVGFRAERIEDLEVLARAEGVAVEPLGEPGGGSVVRLRDPDGFTVEVVAGQSKDRKAPPWPIPCATPPARSRASASSCGWKAGRRTSGALAIACSTWRISARRRRGTSNASAS